MTVTVLPGQVGDSDTSTPPPPVGGGSRRLVLVAVAVVVVLVAGVTWFVTSRGGTDSPAAVPPVARTPRAQHPATLAAHGRPSRADLRAVGTPVFAAMNAALGGWTHTGRLHIHLVPKHGKFDQRLQRCAGLPDYRSSVVRSGKYGTQPLIASGGIEVFASPTVARKDMNSSLRSRTQACTASLFPQALAKSQDNAGLEGSKVRIVPVRGVPHGGLMRMVVAYVIHGQEVPVEVDSMAAPVGRTEVSVTVMSGLNHFSAARERKVLRAMLAQVRPALKHRAG